MHTYTTANHQISNTVRANNSVLFIFIIAILFFTAAPAFPAVTVSLAWDESGDTSVTGYQIYTRTEGVAYNYNAPAWTGTDTRCTLTGIAEDTTYYIVARARTIDGTESTDSNEVSFYRASPTDETPTDGTPTDGTPTDETPTDGTPTDDTDSIDQGSYWNSGPNTPILLSPANGADNLDLIPMLQVDRFTDPDSGDTHAGTHWQISTSADFSTPVFQVTTGKALELLSVSELFLVPDQTYFWRVRFFDNHGASSAWSDPFLFRTVTTSPDDRNNDGVPDALTVTEDIDLDRNTESDIDQDDIKVMRTRRGTATIGIKLAPTVGRVESIDLIDPESISETENRPPEMPTELIGYRLAVDKGARVQVQIYLTEDVPEDAAWYKYDPTDGWQDYTAHTRFVTQDNGTTKVLLDLEDGGIGDADGTVNGTIIDPSGPGLMRSAADSSVTVAASKDGSGGCFIGITNHDDNPWRAGVIVLAAIAAVMMAIRRGQVKQPVKA